MTHAWSARTLDEALRLRADHPEALILAGGTDLMVQRAAGGLDPAEVLDLWSCRELAAIEPEAGGLRVGALATWTDVAAHPAVPAVLRDCARTIGAVQIQNRGTVGGNIVNASPAGDSLPVWLALDARFEVASVRGARRVAAADFFRGYRQVDLAADEILTAVHLPAPAPGEVAAFRKVGTRRAQSISKVVFAGRLRLDGDRVALARLAFGSVAPVPLRAVSAEAALEGGPVRPEAADAVLQDIAPIDDVRSTARYRARVAVAVARAWLRDVAGAGA